jgi:hypothetical protein
VHDAMILLLNLLFELFPEEQRDALRSDAWATMLFSILDRHGWSEGKLRVAKYSLPDEMRQVTRELGVIEAVLLVAEAEMSANPCDVLKPKNFYPIHP